MGKWEMVKLGEVCKLINGYAFDSKYFTDKQSHMPIIRIRDVVRGNTESYTSESYKECYVVKKGDILIGMDGEFNISQWKGENAVLNQRVCKISSNTNCLENRFLLFSLPNLLKKIESATPYVTVKHLSSKTISGIELPLPPLEVQRKIADVLDRAAALIEKRKAQIEKLDLLIKSRFIEMFGDPQINPHNWEIKTLNEFYFNSRNAVKCGPFGSALKKDEYIPTGIPVWTMDNISKDGSFIDKPFLYISNKKLCELRAYEVKDNDILISRAGTVGKMCVVKSEFKESVISTNLIRLRLNEKLTPLYFTTLIRVWGAKVCRLQTGAEGAFTHMNTRVLDSIQFPYPEISLQNVYGEFAANINKHKILLLQALTKLKCNFNSLMQKCFRGEIF